MTNVAREKSILAMVKMTLKTVISSLQILHDQIEVKLKEQYDDPTPPVK